MASPTQWTWVWVNSGSWWWKGGLACCSSWGVQRVRQDWVTELNWTDEFLDLYFQDKYCVCQSVSHYWSLQPHGLLCNLPGSFVHGILQARILELVAMPFSRGSFCPRNQTPVSWIAGRFFTAWDIRKAYFSGEFHMNSCLWGMTSLGPVRFLEIKEEIIRRRQYYKL